MISLSLLDCLFRMCTAAMLSMCKIMQWLRNLVPQISKANTIGNISLNVIGNSFKGAGHLPISQWVSKIAPKPKEPAASVYKSREGEVTHLSCKSKLLPLKNSTKMSQAERSFLAALLRVTLWLGCDTPLVRSTILRKKHRPGRTTAQQKLNRPKVDCNACNLTLRHFWYARRRCLTVSNLSCGKRASMETESSSRPIKVKPVHGSTVLSTLIGTPNFSHNDKKLCRWSLHALDPEGPKIRISSKMCRMKLMPSLFCAIHFKPELKRVKIAAALRSPIVRQVS